MRGRPTDPPVMGRDNVRGDATGLMIPAHGEALRDGGPDFLTRAFQAYGALPGDNTVSRITRIEPVLVGSTGHKLFLSVEYRHADPVLPREFFVKFSRHFEDPFHDRRRFELESEIRLYDLSRHPAFPIDVPRPMFGDFNARSGTGLLITERIGFGRGGIEPLRAKCMDEELDRPVEYYRAILSTLARLAGAHKSGSLSPDLERLFPFDRDLAETEDPIAWSEADIRRLVGQYVSFARTCPGLVPAHLTTPAFTARLERSAILVRNAENAIKRFLHADPDYVALSHFNANIDNAWFRRADGGALTCGLFDWQRARQMNLGYALWGGLCGAGPEIWRNHLDDLLAHFIGEYEAHGGPPLELGQLRLHLHLYTATIGLAGLFDAPSLILSRLPEAPNLAGPDDPRLRADEAARCFRHIFVNFLDFWEADGFGEQLEDLVRSIAGKVDDGKSGDGR